MRYAIKEIIPRRMRREARFDSDTIISQVRASMVRQLAQRFMEDFGDKAIQYDRVTGDEYIMFDLSVDEESQVQHFVDKAERRGYASGRKQALSELPWGFDEVYE